MMCEICKQTKDVMYDFVSAKTNSKFNLCIDCLVKEKDSLKYSLIDGTIEEVGTDYFATNWLWKLCNKPQWYSDNYVRNRLRRYKKRGY